MVSLDLPPLTSESHYNREKNPKDKEHDQRKAKKYTAPIDRFKTGKQDPKATKPEQYLPNWILNLIQQSKTKPLSRKKK
jgi:hypothetical protein